LVFRSDQKADPAGNLGRNWSLIKQPKVKAAPAARSFAIRFKAMCFGVVPRYSNGFFYINKRIFVVGPTIKIQACPTAAVIRVGGIKTSPKVPTLGYEHSIARTAILHLDRWNLRPI
jgi:hypothetical protein